MVLREWTGCWVGRSQEVDGRSDVGFRHGRRAFAFPLVHIILYCIAIVIVFVIELVLYCITLHFISLHYNIFVCACACAWVGQ